MRTRAGFAQASDVRRLMRETFKKQGRESGATAASST
jgi:hypothetical protein